MSDTTKLRLYEKGGQLDLMRDKGPSIADMLDEISGGAPAAADGAIALKAGTVFITKAGVAALTLAAPTATTDDFKRLRIVSTTAFAHTVTTPANKINGNKLVGTFAAAVANFLILEAYQGVWYVIGNTGVTLT